MATTEHPTTQLAPIGLLQASVAWPTPRASRPLGETPSRAAADVVEPPAAADVVELPVAADVVEPAVDEEPGVTSTVLLTLGCGVWPFVLILAGLALIVPFLAGLVVVGLVGAVVLPPYLLVRHWRGRSDRHVDDRAA
jgi:hypothetical protein